MSISTATLAAFACCLAGAVLEGLLSGSGARMRFAELKMPKYSPPFRVWVLIGIAYYGLCFILLRRLFGMVQEPVMQWTAISLILLLLAGNAVWNYLFFRRQSLRACILAFIPYGLLVLALIVVTAFLYPTGSVLLSCYFLYLLYAAWWSHQLLKLN